MNHTEYRMEVSRYCTNSSRNTQYLHPEFISEVGELLLEARKVFQFGRSDYSLAGKDRIKKEVGDVLWFMLVPSTVLPELPGPNPNLVDAFWTKVSPVYVTKRQANAAMEELLEIAVMFNSQASKCVREPETTEVRRRKMTECLNRAVPCLWFVIAYLGVTLQECAELNAAKLAERFANNKIHGDGSDR